VLADIFVNAETPTETWLPLVPPPLAPNLHLQSALANRAKPENRLEIIVVGRILIHLKYFHEAGSKTPFYGFTLRSIDVPPSSFTLLLFRTDDRALSRVASRQLQVREPYYALRVRRDGLAGIHSALGSGRRIAAGCRGTERLWRCSRSHPRPRPLYGYVIESHEMGRFS
jgi:hypothetical protein